MVKAGHQPGVIVICGGLRKNSLYVQTHADVTGEFLLLLVLQNFIFNIKLVLHVYHRHWFVTFIGEKWKVFRKRNLHGKIAALVLLKLFNNGNK